jgi:predicted RNA-binding Zn-ribbon protein involved in translation (DUF1610 family)
MELTYRCGHVATVDDAVASAVCPVCGSEGVSRAKVRRPTFRGACVGPLAQTDLTIPPFRERLVVKEG